MRNFTLTALAGALTLVVTTQDAAAQRTTPVTVENDDAIRVVTDSGREQVFCDVSLRNSAAGTFSCQRSENSSSESAFEIVPDGYRLYITNILINQESLFPIPDAPMRVRLGRLVPGTNFPGDPQIIFSSSAFNMPGVYTSNTPFLVFQSGEGMRARRDAPTTLNINFQGYLEPVE